MTNKEAIEMLKDHFRVHNDGRPTPYLDEAVNTAIEVLETADKYKWHDLRKNPDDMPEFDTCTLVCIDYRFDDRPEYTAIYVSSANWKLDIMEDYDPEYWQVIAWRYIEPFEEDKE